MRRIMKIFGQGLMAVIPLVFTLGLILGIGMWIERLLANPFKELFPDG